MKIRKLPLLLSALFVMASCSQAGTNSSSSPSSEEVTSSEQIAPSSESVSSTESSSSSSSSEETKKYLISFDLKGGTSSSSISAKTVESLSSSDFFFDCAKKGYSFRGWSYNGSKVFDEAGQQVSTPTMDSYMVFTADWEAISYTITYEVNGGTNSSANPTSYTIEEPISLSAPSRPGYTFAGWYSDPSFTSLSLSFDGNKTFYAKWSAIDYSISYELNGGTNSPSNPASFTAEEEVTLGEPTKAGYAFDGWYSDEALQTQVTSIPKGSTSSVKVYAKWNLLTYTISYELDGGTNNSSNANSYNTEQMIALGNPTRKGYTFAGWYFDSSFKNGTYNIPLGSSGNKTLYAKWSANKNSINVTVTKSAESSLDDAWTRYGDGYTDTEALVGAVPADGSAFKGWYDSDGRFLSRSAQYKFTMPANDISLEAVFWTTEEETAWKKSVGAIPEVSSDGKTLTYGLYPTTHVNDAVTLASLNNLKTTDTNGYYRFNDVYYAKCVGRSAAPGAIQYKFDDNTDLNNGETYWFKCEPIKWNILKNENGTYSLVSSLLLDARRFDASSSIYKDSEIREWLTTDFYDAAFALDSSYLDTVHVDNTGATRWKDIELDGDGYTDDKVYLLSYQDYINASLGFNSSTEYFDPARYTLTTDWARANGGWYRYFEDYNKCGDYWTRSSGNGDDVASYIDEEGWLHINWNVAHSNRCVRPAIQVTIAS